MPIRFFNTLTRKVEEFVPIKEGQVLMYTCGPTIYNTPHIGNLRTFVFEDLLHRWLSFRGFEVHHVMNLTDIDDKTIKNSILKKMSLKEYTDIYRKEFFDSIQALNFMPAEYYPAATEYIPEMIKLVEGLLEKGFAYDAPDGVYYKVSAFSDYGKLSHIDKSSLLAGASGRMSQDEYTKDEVSDFALWKKWTPEDGDVKWSAPFGEGRPGWHIECSAMSMRLLGETLDIHCGGVDNMFPHHENEIAQSEAYTGKKFVNYWLHSVHLMVDGEKMAKSKGNFYTIKDMADKGYSSRVLRYALLTTHYRKPLNFTFDLLKQADSSLKRIGDFIFDLKNIPAGGKKDAGFSKALEDAVSGFEASLDDDLNISEAMAAIFDLISYYYEHRDSVSKENAAEILDFMEKADLALGFIKEEKNEALSEEEAKLIEERTAAKKNRDFTRADAVRARLLELGIEVRDTKDGVVWKRIR